MRTFVMRAGRLGAVALIVGSLSLVTWAGELASETAGPEPTESVVACEEHSHPGYQIMPYPSIDEQLAGQVR